MKNPFSKDFRPEAPRSAEKMVLPVGAYVCKIMGVKTDSTKMVIQVDVSEGEFESFYSREYHSQNSQFRAPKYRGTYTMMFPDGNNPDIDKIRERTAAGAVWAVEKSNPGWKWDWDHIETDLKGKTVGINVRERDWCMQSSQTGEWMTGTTYEIGQLEDANAVREGKVKPMKKRELSKRDKERMGTVNQEPVAAAVAEMHPVDEEEIPF